MPELVQRVAHGKEKLPVEFDELSVPHEGRTKFASDLGVIARSKAPVGAKNWKNDVSPTIKDSIWEDIRVKFDINDSEEIKKRVISMANGYWKQFKGYLGEHMDAGWTNDEIIGKYNYVEPEKLQKLREYRQTPEFLENRKKNKDNAAKNVHPHKISRVRYDGVMKKYVKTAGDGESSVTSPSSRPPRSKLWVWGRLPSDGVVKNPETKKAIEAIEFLEAEESAGNFVPSGERDVLTVALKNLEHGGRVRTTGPGVSKTEYFGRKEKLTPDEELKKKVKSMEEKADVLAFELA